MSAKPYEPGAVFKIAYPFVRDVYTDCDEGGPFDRKTWKPGANIEETQYGSEVWANGEGSATFTVVDCIKPGRFPMRVFYTRQFTTPDGHVFGKTKLHMATADKFRRLTRGYRYDYEVEDLISPPGRDAAITQATQDQGGDRG